MSTKKEAADKAKKDDKANNTDTTQGIEPVIITDDGAGTSGGDEQGGAPEPSGDADDSAKTEPAVKQSHAKARPGYFGKILVRSVSKSGFYRCGRHFQHDSDTELSVVRHPVTRAQISVEVANKLDAEPMLIVKRG